MRGGGALGKTARAAKAKPTRIKPSSLKKPVDRAAQGGTASFSFLVKPYVVALKALVLVA